MTDYKAMIARDLLKALQGLSEADLDLPITTEGCDCLGDVAKVVVQSLRGLGCYRSHCDGRSVLLWRTDGRLKRDEDQLAQEEGS